jgi:hypothetical protein
VSLKGELAVSLQLERRRDLFFGLEKVGGDMEGNAQWIVGCVRYREKQNLNHLEGLQGKWSPQ